MTNPKLIEYLMNAFSILAEERDDPMNLTKRQALWSLYPAVEEIFEGPKVEEERRAWSSRVKIAYRGEEEAYAEEWRYMVDPFVAAKQLDVFRGVAEFVTEMIGTTPPEFHKVASTQRTRGLAVSLSRRGGVAPQHWSCSDGHGGAFIIRAWIARGDWQENGSIAHLFFEKASEAFPERYVDSPIPYTGTATHAANPLRIKCKDKEDG